MANTLEITKMTKAEKLQAMEALWSDLSKDPEGIKSPGWHKKLLQKTESRVAAGEEKILDWGTAKRELRKKFG